MLVWDLGQNQRFRSQQHCKRAFESCQPSPAHRPTDLEVQGGQAAVGPGAGQGDVQVVPPRLGLEAVLADVGPEAGGRAVRAQRFVGWWGGEWSSS